MDGSSASSYQPPHSSSAPSYLVAGVLFYGMVGWLLDQWLGTRFLVAAGILVGGGLGTYMMIVQLRRQTAAQDARDQRTSNTQTSNEESE
jgi:F0F1-type ATP synthase assembly protein I